MVQETAGRLTKDGPFSMGIEDANANFLEVEIGVRMGQGGERVRTSLPGATKRGHTKRSSGPNQSIHIERDVHMRDG